MSFLKKLFGSGKPAEPAGPLASAEHDGFTIHATPYQENGQWQLCGEIEKEIAGTMKRHRFVRADRFASQQDAIDMSLMKARQIIDQSGEKLFRD